jgi:hypothetical protein
MTTPVQSNLHTQTEQPCTDCGETHKPFTLDYAQGIQKKIRRRFNLFKFGLFGSIISTCVCVSLYHPALGGAVISAFLTYFCQINLSVLLEGDAKLGEVIKALSFKNTDKVLSNKENQHGQYL